MKRIEGKPREIKRVTDGKIVAVLDIQVSTTDDLPHIGDEFENYIVAAGTIAQVIQDGVFLTLDDDDNYYHSASDSEHDASLSVSTSLDKSDNGKLTKQIEEPERDGEDDDELL